MKIRFFFRLAIFWIFKVFLNFLKGVGLGIVPLRVSSVQSPPNPPTFCGLFFLHFFIRFSTLFCGFSLKFVLSL